MSNNTSYVLDKSHPTIHCPQYGTENLLKNIKNIQHSSILLEPSKFLTQDTNSVSFLNINLHETNLQNKHIHSLKLKFVSKTIDGKQVFAQEYIDSNVINVKFKVLCKYNVIFDDEFYQDTNLLTSSLILPMKCLNGLHGTLCIHILNISNLLPLLNDIDLQILYDEVNFYDEVDLLLPNMQLDQVIQTKANTYNVFRIMFGMGAKAFDVDLPKDKFNEVAHKIHHPILV